MAEYDLVVRGGTVVDGTGAPSRTADVAARGRQLAQALEPLGESFGMGLYRVVPTPDAQAIRTALASDGVHVGLGTDGASLVVAPPIDATHNGLEVLGWAVAKVAARG